MAQESKNSSEYISEYELRIINDRNNSTTIGELKECLKDVSKIYDNCKVFIWNDDGTIYSPKTIGMAMDNNKKFSNENTGHEIFTLTQSS